MITINVPANSQWAVLNTSDVQQPHSDWWINGSALTDRWIAAPKLDGIHYVYWLSQIVDTASRCKA